MSDARQRIAARARSRPAPPPAPGAYPISWWVRTGRGRERVSYQCDQHGFYDRIGKLQTDRPEWNSSTRAKCPTCGTLYRGWSQSWDEEFSCPATGAVLDYAELPIGGVIADAKIKGRVYAQLGPDGRSLRCKLPDGHWWAIDSRANNCTMPDDSVHRCWVRVGKPEDGTLHVSKDGGPTCAAGAGSIMTSNYHGFLHHGRLVPT